MAVGPCCNLTRFCFGLMANRSLLLIEFCKLLSEVKDNCWELRPKIGKLYNGFMLWFIIDCDSKFSLRSRPNHFLNWNLLRLPRICSILSDSEVIFDGFSMNSSILISSGWILFLLYDCIGVSIDIFSVTSLISSFMDRYWMVFGIR